MCRCHDDDDDDGTIKTYDTSVTFTKYNDHKIIKVFDKGIVLLGVITRINNSITPYAGKVYYDFSSVNGSIQMEEIRGEYGDYVALNKYSNDAVLNIKNIHTVPKPCSITTRLPPPNNIPNVKPSKPIKIHITIQYIEFPTRNYGS